MEDEVVPVDDRTRSGPLLVIETKFLILPQNSAASRVQAGASIGAEGDVNSPAFEYRCRRGVGIEGIFLLRPLDAKDLHIMKYLSSIAIDTECTKRAAVPGRGRHPDLAPPHDRRRPPLAGNRGLEPDILRFRPFHRQASGIRVSLLAWATKLRPVLSRLQFRGELQ